MLNQLRERIDILQPGTQDTTGGLGAPADFITGVAAGVADLQGREAYGAGQFGSDLKAKFIVRYDRRITAAHMVRFDGKLYTIDAVRDPGKPFRRFYLELLCTLYNG